MITLYADGSHARQKTFSIGAWAAKVIHNGKKTRRYFGVVVREDLLCMELELRALVQVIPYLPQDTHLKIYTDSKTIVQAFELGLYAIWQRRDWRKKKNGPVLFRPLWEKLIALNTQYSVEWVWLKGHTQECSEEHIHHKEVDKFSRQLVRCYRENQKISKKEGWNYVNSES